MYTIHLHQTSQEIQTEFTSDSRDEITKLWEYATTLQDEYTEIDELLTLSYKDVVFDSYLITEEQRVH